MMGITIKQVAANSAEYRQVYNLREAVLRRPIGLSLANEDLSIDGQDIILVAMSGNDVAGCLMLQHKSDNTIKFRQMAVAADMQGKGIGNMLIGAAESLSREKGYSRITLHARETAEKFYTRLGYTITTGLFTEVGIPHYMMEKTL